MWRNIGIVVQTADAEQAWSAFRLANRALDEGHEVRVFLLSQGVLAGDLGEEPCNVNKQMRIFIANDGQLWACGKCLALHEKEAGELCPFGGLKDLLELVEWADKLLTF
ncbi:DsrE family protein [Candidatus Desulforudis audaxviator]|uniref:DsrE family protein n=1 Tax=Desulforudis audaxviator (strain MP104C) TaxID=477974 RepID=B1I0T5_DESAP|nr:DsrE family protein [Candidatus Desulforudis audaxviator]ACA58731.1 DsrE family protein [Candidatus Desulforudis audaxviator MP104C]AZK58739.1 DsrE family protein [Candidatus Desulforudis audaxviator]